MRRIAHATALSLALVLAITACSDDGDGSDAAEPARDTSTTRITSADDTTTTSPEPLVIVVTNDDGIGAPGIDVLVDALAELPEVEIHVVAPAADQSGTSDRTTPGGASYADSETAGGTSGVAVDGYPADTIAVALDDLGLEPDLVVSGINKGQNIGPLVPISGTVGAARAAARRGVPALAVSAELADTPDYDAGAYFAVAWVADHRDELDPGANDERVVANLNVPTCDAGGEVRGVLDVPVAAAFPADVSAGDLEVDCNASATAAEDDVAALLIGYASLSDVPAG
jgi:5'-nucleotidase